MNTMEYPMENQTHNRQCMRDLCALAGSQREAAELIAEYTRRPCSADAVKSWTCDVNSSRARTCHDWAVEALENALRKINKVT